MLLGGALGVGAYKCWLDDMRAVVCVMIVIILETGIEHGEKVREGDKGSCKPEVIPTSGQRLLVSN